MSNVRSPKYIDNLLPARRLTVGSRLQDTPIYKYIKEYVSFIPVLTFQKGEYLFRGEDNKKIIYYILDGVVEVENVTYNGKKLIIENVQQHTFIGSVADMYHVDLQSSGVAVTDVEALALPEMLMNRLMKNDKFSIYFYQETSSRVFRLYKTVLARILFSPSEILAHHILENMEQGIFAYKSSYALCEAIGISRRGIYDILYRFEEMGSIKKRGSSVYEIVDKICLEKQAEHMISFMQD